MPSVNVATNPTEVLPRGSRNAVVFQNLSDTDIFVGARGNVTAAAGENSGLRVRAAGGTFALTDLFGSRAVADAAIFAVHAGTGTKELRYEIF
jgi:hypothetical protein